MSITPHNFGRSQGWEDSDLTSRDRATERYPVLTIVPAPVRASGSPSGTPHSAAWYRRRTLARAIVWTVLPFLFIGSVWLAIIGLCALLY